MKNRYIEELLERTNDESTRYYGTALPANKADATLGTTHRVRFGDRFDNLAYRYYRTPTLWWYIAKANDMLNGSLTPPVGSTIIIPKL